jgi:subtilisin family serine protease
VRSVACSVVDLGGRSFDEALGCLGPRRLQIIVCHQTLLSFLALEGLMRYIILKTAASKGAVPRPGAITRAASSEVEVGELKVGGAAKLAKKRSVLAMAPAIPMKLLAPVKKAAATLGADAGGVTWGVKAVGADRSAFNGEGIIVAVLDTGIDPSHPAFSGVELLRKNFTDESDDDLDGHGTHCAGTIFGRDVNGVRIGVARGVKQALIAKVLGKGGGGSDQIVRAIQWAVNNGANVISMSLLIDFPGLVKQLEMEGLPTEPATSIALEGYRTNILLFERLASFIVAQGAFAQGTVLVAAAGNESRRPKFEIAVDPPAVADGVISVAALGNGPAGFEIAYFSNVGARVSGPGVNVDSARLGGGLESMCGTSMAAPHVAGVAALWADKLLREGSLNGKLLADRLIGNAATHGIKEGFDPADVGAGMVRAPIK